MGSEMFILICLTTLSFMKKLLRLRTLFYLLCDCFRVVLVTSTVLIRIACASSMMAVIDFESVTASFDEHS